MESEVLAYLAFRGELPDILKKLTLRSPMLVEKGTALDVSKQLLKAGGGSLAQEREWSLVALEAPAREALRDLVTAIMDSVKKQGEFAARLEDLPVPVSFLDAVARASSTVVTIAALFESDPDRTWQD